jgi:light-regulated signal transduction histidine kinase (bacteriophytochrome)
LHRLNTKLEAANDELEAFAHTVSHDLRAPLRHIRSYAQYLTRSDSSTLSEPDREFLEHIVGATERMNRLIEDLLAFSRMGMSDLRQVSINPQSLLDEVFRQIQPEIGMRNIVWKRNPLPSLQADPALLRQVFINLLLNAVKYSRPRNPAEIEIGCLAETPDEIVIFIRDNGVGFDMKYANKLFGVFQRLHRQEEFEGTGVGLANVRRIIARHGGRTWAEGKIDYGATFYFTLPSKVPGIANEQRLA